MFKQALNISKHIISLVIIGGLIYFLYENWDSFKSIANVTWQHIVALVACILLTWIVNSVQLLYLFRMQNIKISFWENLIIQTATILANYLPMRIGTIIRFQYFKKVHGIEYSRFGGIVVLRTLILIFATGLFGMVGLLGLYIDTKQLNFLFLFSFILMLFLPMLAYFIPKPGLSDNPEKKLHKLRKNLTLGFILIHSKHKLVVVIMLLLIIQFILLALRLYISFDVLQIELSIWLFLLLAPVSTLLAFITITPGNLGLREWIIGGVSVAAGYDFNNAIFAGSIDRVALISCTFLFGSFSAFYVWYKMNKKN